ncbi:hypothetical protein M8J76_015415 [Diaphorina citri]|nr:hypothetical protein M8J75_009713 [Diaphorina citri]KAI5716973.1 hypothetical protein M8J76_015415 [Diaphorina citri]
MEEKARKSWQDKWKFLEKDNIEKLHQELSLKLGLDQDFIKSRYRGEKEKQEMEYLQNLKRMPVPRLTSGMIGWRSSDPECWIDMSGLMYVSDKTYPLSEPTQSLHEQWKCIWLG